VLKAIPAAAQVVWSLSEADLTSITPKSVRDEVERRFGLENGDLSSFRKEIIQEIGEAAATWSENHFEYEDDSEDSNSDGNDHGSGRGRGENEKKD
jgi:hypothetical protein